MTTRDFARWIGATLFCGLATSSSFAEVGLYLSDSVGSATAVQIVPGGGFDVEVGLGTTEGAVAFTYYVTISDNGSGKFAITGRTVPLDTVFPDLISPDSQVLSPASALLDPHNNHDLGALAADVTIDQPPGIYRTSVLTLTSAPDVPLGTYTLSISGGVSGRALEASNSNGDSLPITPHSYTIVVGDGSAGSGSDGGTTGGDTGTGGGSTGSTDGTSTGGTGTDTGTGTGGTGPDTPVTNDGSTGGTDDGTGSTGNSGDQTTNEEPADASAEGDSLAGCGAGTTASAASIALCLGLMRSGRRRPGRRA